VACLLTPDPDKNTYTYPPEVRQQIEGLVGSYPVDVKGFRTDDREWLKNEIYAMSRKQFTVARHLMRNTEWDYFQFVEIGLDRMQHAFWGYHDAGHARFQPGHPFQEAVRDYYCHLDHELGELLEVLDEETVVLVASDHGAQRLVGCFCINQWLVEQGLLVLQEYPRQATPFRQLHVDWSRTTAWAEGGYYARVFLNVKGREPQGSIDPKDYATVRDDVKARLESVNDEQGRPMGTTVFRPEEIYRSVKGVPPDLIAYLGGLAYRSLEGVGYPSVYSRENDTGPDHCNHAPFGAFVLAAPNNPLHGELTGVGLLDIAPTLLQLGGYDVPGWLQGRTKLDSPPRSPAEQKVLSPPEEQAIRERLRGLGYI
jgi:predicted AlkP superfamily phosphohydrolase/phosphomutase